MIKVKTATTPKRITGRRQICLYVSENTIRKLDSLTTDKTRSSVIEQLIEDFIERKQAKQSE